MKHARWESPSRYYVAKVYQDLFNDWVLTCARGGRKNRLGALMTKPVVSREGGLAMIQAIDKVRKSHGYVRVL